MTQAIKELLHSSSDILKHMETPLLDSEVLLSYALKKPREFLHAHPEQAVDEKTEQAFMRFVERRAKHEPVAYLTNTKAFYGRDFYVDKRVHIPRPATEDMVRLVLDSVPADFSGTIADIGTGSGCIAITLALELPNAHVIATDISEDALQVAKQNADRVIPIDFRQGDLLDPITEPVDIIVSNPPYGWGAGWSDDPEVFFQPKESHQSGADGLAHIGGLLKNIPEKLAQNGQAFIEFDPRQRQALEALLGNFDYGYEFFKDTAGFDRVLRLTKPQNTQY